MAPGFSSSRSSAARRPVNRSHAAVKGGKRRVRPRAEVCLGGRRAAKESRGRPIARQPGPPCRSTLSRYRVKLAETEAERAGAQRLRYRVFVEEMGAQATPRSRRRGANGTSSTRSSTTWSCSSLDPEIADPLDRVVGVYRLMRGEAARGRAGLLRRRRVRPGADRRVGRGRASSSGGRASRASTAAGRRCTCSGTGSRATCWSADIELLFGVASFHGTDPAPLAEALAFLHHEHLAPPDLRVRAQPRALPRHGPDAARGDRRGRGRCRRSRR